MELLTPRELYQALKISKTTLYRLLQRGLPSIGTGRMRRFEDLAVRQWLETGEAQAPTPTLMPPGSYECQTCLLHITDCKLRLRDDFFCPACKGQDVQFLKKSPLWRTEV